MAWIAAIIAAAAGGISAAQQKKAAQKGTSNAGINLEAAYGAAKGEFQPYSEAGKSALTRLSELQGLEGYRTPADIALREHLSSAKPTLNYAGDAKKDAAEKWFSASPSNKVLAAMGAGGGGGAGKLNKKRRERAAINAANMAAAQEKLAQEQATYDAKTKELTKQRDLELQNYNQADTTKRILESTPGYQFRYNTGLGAVGSNQAARNATLGGRALKELTQYGQDFGSGEYQNEVSRLSQLAGMGERSATALGNLSVGQGTGLAGLNMTSANADVGYYGDLNNVVQSSLGNYLAYQQRQQRPTTQSPYASSYDSNSPTSNPGYIPGQTLDPADRT